MTGLPPSLDSFVVRCGERLATERAAGADSVLVALLEEALAIARELGTSQRPYTVMQARDAQRMFLEADIATIERLLTELPAERALERAALTGRAQQLHRDLDALNEEGAEK